MSSKNFETKDGGGRKQFDSGMEREPQSGKPRFDLLIPKDQPYEETLMYRAAMLMSRGVDKYSTRNWEKANSIEEMDRFKSAALRHMMQVMSDEKDEDHLSAVLFNITAISFVEWKLKQQNNGEIDGNK